MPKNSLALAASPKTTAPLFFGCFIAGGQPELRLVFDMDDLDMSVSLPQLDAWLDAALMARPPWPQCLRQSLTHAVLSRALVVAQTLLQAGRMPIFDTGRVVSFESLDSETKKRTRLDVRVPAIDHIPASLISSAYQVAVNLLVNAATQIAKGLEPDISSARATAQNQIIHPFQSAIPTGISTVPILREAWRRSVPFRHLGGGVFQLGWGAKSRRLNRSSVDQDSALGSAIANWKTHTTTILGSLGLPCPQHVLVQDVSAARDAARRLGWPVVIKPANRERSEGVTTHIDNDSAVENAFAHAGKFSKSILVEKQVPGICYRLMIANGSFLYALWRKPMSVLGNGQEDVASLLSALQAKAEAWPAWAREKTVPLDDLTRQVLKSQGMTEHTVPADGQRVLVRWIESTEWGEDRGDATAQTHADNVKLAERAARAIGLSNAGVDIISPDISVPWHVNGAMINEVNYAPHFGGTEVARSRMPAFIDGLMEGDGRIPVEVFIGKKTARQAAERQQSQWRAAGLRAWVTGATDTCDDQGARVPMACTGSFARTLALLGDHQVQALAIVLEDASWASSGAPLDRIDAWHDLRDGAQDEAHDKNLFKLLAQLAQK